MLVSRNVVHRLLRFVLFDRSTIVQRPRCEIARLSRGDFSNSKRRFFAETLDGCAASPGKNCELVKPFKAWPSSRTFLIGKSLLIESWLSTKWVGTIRVDNFLWNFRTFLFASSIQFNYDASNCESVSTFISTIFYFSSENATKQFGIPVLITSNLWFVYGRFKY